jgi:hypothetical protein
MCNRQGPWHQDFIANAEFPGQHDVSFYMPEVFAKTVLSTIKRWKDDKVAND